MELGESALLKNHGKNKNRGKDKEKNKIPAQADSKKKESKCFFCKKKGHIKKDYAKFKQWLVNKGNPLSYICFESNMVEVSHTLGGLILDLQFTFQLPCRV